MKTHKHGNGMSHADIVHFSNRLAASASFDPSPSETTETEREFLRGWHECAKFFAHELRKELRFTEQLNQIQYNWEKL